jgi:hypothetical protein
MNKLKFSANPHFFFDGALAFGDFSASLAANLADFLGTVIGFGSGIFSGIDTLAMASRADLRSPAISWMFPTSSKTLKITKGRS